MASQAENRVKEVYIAIVGAGGVGSKVLEQLTWLSGHRTDLRLRLVYLAIIDKALFYPDYTSIEFDTALDIMYTKGSEPPSISRMIEYLSGVPGKLVMVDNTSSQAVASAYPALLACGISIITPNKKAFSGERQLWNDIFTTCTSSGPFVYHESSVGAGMPIISTLNEMVATGDKVARIEGVFSGTMSYLFNSFAPLVGTGGKWSAEVARAKSLGYTEPDPRDDLNGMDVARKLTILGRLAGLPIELPTSFPVQSLIPPELMNITDPSEFLNRLPEFDARMQEERDAAIAEGKVIRFIGSIDFASKQVKVGLKRIGRDHPIAGLQGSDNIISFYTERYGASPLTIRGAGAGGDVTAMGVTGDLLKVIAQL